MGHIDVLQDVKELLITPGHWIKGIIAHNEKGLVTDPIENDACGWCLLGAIDHVAYHNNINRETRNEVQDIIYKVLEEQRGMCSIPDFNDDHNTKHSDILDVLDEAIASCE